MNDPTPVQLDGVLQPIVQPSGAIDPRQVQHRAEVLERAGAATIWSPEAAHDPFLTLALAASATTTARLATGVAVAFGKSPMHLAYTANDLQAMSGGRFVLGLGTQVQAHIERRFGGSWSRPAARMRETVLALRAIWDFWGRRSDKLDFEGQFTRHTLMPSLFDPGPNPYPSPPIFLAAVGSKMAEVAGEVADGVCLHTFTSARYLTDVTVPALGRGRTRVGLEALPETYLPVFVVTGSDSRETDDQRAAVRAQLAFYASTPGYRGVLELHGWEAVGVAASSLARAGRWDELSTLVDDEMLHTFAVVAEPQNVGRHVRARFGGLVDRVSLSTPSDWTPETEHVVTSNFY